MNPVFVAPAFITFTGVDTVALIPGMRRLSAQYPIEWGVLIDPARHGHPLFPEGSVIDRLRACGLRLSAHVCGEPASRIANGLEAGVALTGFSRIQINHGMRGSSLGQIERCMRFAARHGLRPALQCQEAFPEVTGVDWLYDVSFGNGVQPGKWLPLGGDIPFCGYSGGLNAQNVSSILQRLELRGGRDYWIDMESGVRTDGHFDLAKCEAVCQAVYGQASAGLAQALP